MNQGVKIEGFIFKKISLLNRDLVITVFSRELGRVRVFAKGIKKLTSRRGPHIETGNLINAVLSKNKEYYFLQETNLISGFSQIKKDQSKSQCLYLLLFILEKLLPENQKEEKMYKLFKSFMIDLSKRNDYQVMMTDYLNNTVSLLGYQEKNKDKDFIEVTTFIEEIINEKLPAFNI
jgi:DNA repair protein RecO (recombination protein O)